MEVSIEENPFEHYYNKYLNQYTLSEEHVQINLPDDDVTRIVMLIDDFYDSVDAEYHFGTPRNIEFFQELSSLRDSIIDGDIEDLLVNVRDLIEVCSDDEQYTEVIEVGEKIIDGLMAYRKKKD